MNPTQHPDVGLADEEPVRLPIPKADPTSEAGAHYLDPRVGGHRADIGFGSFRRDPFESDWRARAILAAHIRKLRPGDRRAQRARADVGVLVDLRRHGLSVYTDDSGPLLHITAHGAFATATGGMQCLSYSYLVGEPRFRARRWLVVTPRAIEQCMHANRAASLDEVRAELCLLLAGTAPIANLAMAERSARLGIPTLGGIFAGGFARGTGLLIREYIGRDADALPAPTWQAHRELFDGREWPDSIESAGEASDYREHLVKWLEMAPRTVGIFRAAGERDTSSLVPGSEHPELPARASVEVEYPDRGQALREVAANGR